MKTTLFLLLFAQITFAQKAISFDEARASGLNIVLDSLYANGIDTDSSLAVFKDAETYIAAYQQLLQDLGEYLKKNNFNWEKPVKGFNRIYFSKSGKIDYFLYSFRPDQLTMEQENRFNKILGRFVKKYRFPLKAKQKFAQCSPVTFMPMHSEK